MLRDMAFSYFFGAAGLMDSWVIAFQIPNLARRLFGEGAASASFIPVYSEELQADPEKAGRLANTVVTVIFTSLAAVVLLGVIGIWIFSRFYQANDETKMMLSLISLMLPYMVMICTVAILAGILHVHRHFAAPAAAPVVLNICIIVAILVTGWMFKMPATQQVFIVASAVLLAGVIQIAMQFIPLCKHGVSIKPAWDVRSDAFKKIMILMGPMIIGLTVTQINTLADNWIARGFSGSIEKGEFFTFLGSQIQYPLWRGSVSHLYYSQRLYQLPLGVFGIALATAIFPVMSADAARGDFDALRKTISRGFRSAVFVAVPASIGLILVARPLVAVVFERGQFNAEATRLTAWTLCFYALGLSGFFIQQIVTRAFYSMGDSKAPMRSAMIAVAINIALNLTLIWPMGSAGLALSTAVCSYIQVVILIVILRRRLGNSILEQLNVTGVKTFIATVVMSLAAIIAIRLMGTLPENLIFNIVRLVVIVTVSAGVYVIMAKVLKNEMLGLISGKG